MDMSTWAENEVNIACKRINPDWDKESFDYYCSCYKSALKAYKTIMGDEHSGMSFSITKKILFKLLNEVPLTPITDEDFKNVEGDTMCNSKGIKCYYQCPRLTSLFKHVYKDGHVDYNDVSRVVGINIHNHNLIYHSGLTDDIVDTMYPIKLPYDGCCEPYKVYTDDFVYDPTEGDYDTVGVFYMITPEGDKIDINKYYAYEGVERRSISKEEYDERRKVYEQHIQQSK